MEPSAGDPEIRRATQDDVPAIRALTLDAYTKWVAVIDRKPRPMTADHSRAVHEGVVELLHVDGRLAALIEIVVQDDALLIENVAVSPALQGRGLGRRLMAHAEHLAAELGRDTIRLYTHVRFTENVRLYLRLGYRVDREEPVDGGALVHMSKQL